MAKKILIIEDSPTTASVLKQIFEDEGYQAITAESGEVGLKKCEEEKPDIVILDTLLPGIDGFEVCRKVRRDKALPLKIIIMTGNVDAIDAVKAKDVGADDYCAKTSDFSALVKVVKDIYNKS